MEEGRWEFLKEGGGRRIGTFQSLPTVTGFEETIERNDKPTPICGARSKLQMEATYFMSECLVKEICSSLPPL